MIYGIFERQGEADRKGRNYTSTQRMQLDHVKGSKEAWDHRKNDRLQDQEIQHRKEENVKDSEK